MTMSLRRRWPLTALVAGAMAVAGAVVAVPGTAGAATPATPPPCTTVASTVVQGVQIADPACDYSGSAYTGTRFTPITNGAGAASTVYTGILADGSAYRVEVPPDWNHTLVMYAHGYRGTGTVVYVDNPELRSYFVDHGYAWAASSYDENGYDVGSGVIDTHDLMGAFPAITGGPAPSSVIMSGLSMGGAITAVEIEAYKGDFVGAMPY
ncbi:MAG: phthalyl amidase, partial [Acidimicrobiales bacterium]